MNNTQLYGKIDDSPKIISNCDLPLTSFSTYALMGVKGTGKTTLQNKIVQAIIKRNEHLEYDIENPFLI